MEFLYLRSLLERWVSGLNQQFAKLSYVITRTGGSNPPLSAQRFNHLTFSPLYRSIVIARLYVKNFLRQRLYLPT